jgi:hypothetical protein
MMNFRNQFNESPVESTLFLFNVIDFDVELTNTKKKGTKLHFKSPTAERRHASCVGGWRGSNPRRPAPMEQGLPALTSRLLRAYI